MNAKRAVCTGIVAAVLGFGPTFASADPYFALFYGKAQTDLSQGELNTIAEDLTAALGGTPPTGVSDVNDTDTAWGAQIGYRFNRWVAAEIGYVDFGKPSYYANLVSDFGAGPEGYTVRSRFIVTGPTLAVVPTIPLGERFDLYARAGLFLAETRFQLGADFPPDSVTVDSRADTREWFGGLGFAWNINDNYAVRIEGTYFPEVGDDDETGENDIALIAIGVMFR